MNKKRKPIRLKHGMIKKLAEEEGVSWLTVHNAMRYKSDSETQEELRKLAKEKGYIRRF